MTPIWRWTDIERVVVGLWSHTAGDLFHIQKERGILNQVKSVLLALAPDLAGWFAQELTVPSLGSVYGLVQGG